MRHPMLTSDQKLWLAGQLHYEKWLATINARNADQDYQKEFEVDQAIYSSFDISGKLLDIGGGDGRLRAFVDNSTYACCDPFVRVTGVNQENQELIKVYPCINDRYNFVCAYAEHLPFASKSFDVVHMRSCIDHFLNPALAMNEAYRVLDTNGSIVIGMYVEGGKTGRQNLIKDFIRDALGSMGIERYKDYHVWHPSYAELVDLIEESGFSISKEVWQDGYSDTVVYLQCKKI